MPPSALSGLSVVVAGAGLAGLAAARDLVALGATVTVIDARDRVGGRVRTIRDGFTDGQHAEAGGDLIDDTQHAICRLADELGLKRVRILRGGFAHARPDRRGRVRILRRSPARGWDRLGAELQTTIAPYRLAEKRWDTPIAAAIARRSVADWLDAVGADDELRTTAAGMRSFFLAEPDELSLIALVDQFAGMELDAGQWAMYRIDGGNDRLAAALADPLAGRIRLGTELVAVARDGRRVRATVREGRRARVLAADAVVFALPATTLRRVAMTPALPRPQRQAIARLDYGRATKTLIQFTRRFWQTPGRPTAVGSALPFGSLWDGNEQQPGRPGILSLLAGGSASVATQALLARAGAEGLAASLAWLGSGRASILAAQHVTWEDDPWAGGGYAFFGSGFDPAWRAWLARPTGTLFFAGEHTSLAWQGYMNGAVESGRRAAAEVAATFGPLA